MNGAAARTVRISIHALGGQGGGVLSDWIVALAEAHGWFAQATSVPGVAQRTGATVYYVEICPPQADGRAPVLALMPIPGDVDVALAAELMEAGRAVARGLVTPDRTHLIASSHRVFAISEKSALGDGVMSGEAVLEACRASAKRFVMGDLQALAERHGSVISAALFGALAGSAALPFAREAYERVISGSRRGAEASLKAFAAAHDLARAGGDFAGLTRETGSVVGVRQLGSEIAQELPEPVRPIAALGVARLADYQDRAYAKLYLDRLLSICAAERQFAQSAGWLFSREAARTLAVWMSYEDAIRVADLKVRASRFARARADVRAKADQIVHLTEFMHPRFDEVCDVLPASFAKALHRSPWARRAFARFLEGDRQISTTRLRGFLLLYAVASLRPIRRATHRYAIEAERIERWLDSAVNAARTNYDLGVEVLRLQRLVKGYGDTHARGLTNFARIMAVLAYLADRSDGAERLKALHHAALADEEGLALSRALVGLQSEQTSGAAHSFAPVVGASSDGLRMSESDH